MKFSFDFCGTAASVQLLFLLLVVSFVQCDTTANSTAPETGTGATSLIDGISEKKSEPSSPPSSSNILDSINKDLEIIKKTLQTSAESTRNKLFGSSPGLQAKSKPLDGDVDGHYYTESEELKDRPFTLCSKPTDDDSIYRYSISNLNKSLGSIDFAQLKGKPLLLVNVATFCESTIEYPLYNQLKDKFGDKLIIVAFPSNNFQNQEPTSDAEEIYNAIKYVRPGNGFVPKFPLTVRIDVNGENRHPIYSFLKRSCPSTRTRFSKNEANLLYKPKNARDIRWNFEKFLIHPQTGLPIKRYDQKFLPDRIIPDIEELLKEVSPTTST